MARRRGHRKRADPYRVSAAEAVPPPAAKNHRLGPVLILVATVVAPLVGGLVGAVYFALLNAKLAPPTVQRAYLGTLGILQLVGLGLGVVLVIGTYRSSDGEGPSGELTGLTRFASIANAALLVLIAVAAWRDDRMGFAFFSDVGDWVRGITEALLVLTASRHLAARGRHRAATAGRVVAAALPVALVAIYLLTRSTRDEMFNWVGPRHADLVLPIQVALWLGKLAIFASWCLAPTRLEPGDAPQDGSAAAGRSVS